MTVKLTSPELLSPCQRAREIVSLMVLAISRLHATMPKESDIPLGFSPRGSVHTDSSQPGVCR